MSDSKRLHGLQPTRLLHPWDFPGNSTGVCRNAKVGRQEIPGVTGKFGIGVQNEAGQRLTVLLRECTGHRKHPLPKTQEKTLHMDITKWPT